MANKTILISPKEIAKHYDFPYQTMLNWSKANTYKFKIYKILEKNMILNMSKLAESFDKEK